MFSPQTQDFGFRAVGHVDQFLVPPPITDRPGNTSQNDTVITHLQGPPHSKISQFTINKRLGNKIGVQVWSVSLVRTKLLSVKLEYKFLQICQQNIMYKLNLDNDHLSYIAMF